MKEIGETLKEARENIGISIEEAANDLKLRPSQIENIENGNKDAFKDVFYLKYFIRDYAKYLGLNYDDMIDEFNEYMFECTSKISLDDIKKAKKKLEKNKKRENRIFSPYTLEKKNNDYLLKAIAVIGIIVLVILIMLLFLNNDYSENKSNVVESTNIIK